MLKISVTIAVLLSAAFAIGGCKKDKEIITVPLAATSDTPTLPATPYSYLISYPNHITTELAITDNTPAGNPITNDGATLGRVLFYDKILSANNTISCVHVINKMNLS